MTVISLTKGSETFTFADGMVEDIDAPVTNDLDENVMPVSGPMANQGFDLSGVSKTITLTGNLRDTSSSVSNTQDIRDKKIMKYWLESLMNGNQTPLTFTSNYESYSLSYSTPSTMVDSISGATITLYGTFVPTTVKIKKVSFKEEEANPSLIPFTIELWVCSS